VSGLSRSDEVRRPGLWASGLAVLIATLAAVTLTGFNGGFTSSVPVTVTANRAGLGMDSGGKVKLRGVNVGRVRAIHEVNGAVTLQLALDPAAVRYLPANVQARIRATSAFGAKYVDLIYPEHPVMQRLRAGAVVHSTNVTTEVNTVFENLVQVLAQVQPAKLNAILAAFSEGLRDKGDQIGAATTAANDVIGALDARITTLRDDWKSVARVADTYAIAAPDLLRTLSAVSTTSTTIVGQANDLDAALLGAIGLADDGSDLLGPNAETFVNAFNNLRPTTDLLAKYNPEITCTLEGAYWTVDPHGGNAYAAAGGNGRSVIMDTAVGFTVDPYRYPSNLPVVRAKGGPDGKPGCGPLPDVTQHMPVRYLVTDTGWGTGLDVRPNPGIAHPFGVNYFPVTKAIPEPPRVWGKGGPAIGPMPYPGGPPYGAPLYTPDGTPLWAGPPPGAPPPPVPGIPNPPPPYGTGTGPPRGGR
jgi:phospholipid/cholesterol/gamma-HCH transport system substrate-binding protein